MSFAAFGSVDCHVGLRPPRNNEGKNAALRDDAVAIKHVTARAEGPRQSALPKAARLSGSTLQPQGLVHDKTHARYW